MTSSGAPTPCAVVTVARMAVALPASVVAHARSWRSTVELAWRD